MNVTLHLKHYTDQFGGFFLTLAILLPMFMILNSCESNEGDRIVNANESVHAVDSVFEYYSNLIDKSFDVPPPQGDSLIKLASDYFNETLNQRGIAEVLLARSIRSRMVDDYSQALLYIDSAMILADKFESVNQLINLYNTAGLINSRLGHNVTAIEYYNKVYELADSQNDTIGMIYSQGNSAVVYGAMYDWENSKIHTYQAMKLSKASSDYNCLAICHLNIGFYYFEEENNIDSAYHHTALASALINEHCFENLRPILIINSADLEIFSGYPRSALRMLDDLLAESGESMSPRKNAIARVVLGKAHRKLNNYSLSLAYLREADELIESIKEPWLKIKLEKEFYKTYAAMENYQLALQHFKNHNKEDQELTSTNTQTQIADLRNQSHARQKEREIANLKLSRLTQQANRTQRCYIIYLSLLAITLAMTLFYFNYTSLQKAEFATKEKLIAEGKLAVLRSRINPDFILNTFSGVQTDLLKSNRMQAYTYLGKFASLLRKIINSNGEIFNDLELELNIFNDFLELEAMRFQGKFTYEVNVSPELQETNNKIPGMIIEPYVESAIKCKLINEDEHLHLIVNFRKIPDGVLVSILDDNLISTPQLSPTSKRRLAYLRQIGYENTRVELRKNNGNKVLIYLPTT